MTPEEKAKELVSYFFNQVAVGWFTMTPAAAEKCATKVVEEIIKETFDEYTNDENHVRIEYWQSVLNHLKQS